MFAVAVAVFPLATLAGVLVPPKTVPEPATLVLLAVGTGAVALVRRFRK
jgi:hypothetical protein